jgi:urease accessory protein
MLDAAGTALHQRSRGELRLSFKRRGAVTVLDGLRQEGCLKARFPRSDGAEAVLLNTSGGVAGGDVLGTVVAAGPGTRASVATQAAERFYRALPGTTALVGNEIEVAAGAALEWLPQESIFFDGCSVRRTLRVAMAGDASFLGVESLVFGRRAMGETVRRAEIHDLIEIRRAGRLLLHDRVRLIGDVAAALRRRAIGAGSCAVATVVYVAVDAEVRLETVREGLAGFDAGASAWDGMLLARVVAPDAACLRAAVMAALAILRHGRRLPRVWLC